MIKACVFLWNFRLLTGDNKGYNPDHYVIEDAEKLEKAFDEITDKDKWCYVQRSCQKLSVTAQRMQMNVL